MLYFHPHEMRGKEEKGNAPTEMARTGLFEREVWFESADIH